jgi:hypothetical protein
MSKNQIIPSKERCGTCTFWTKANNEFNGIPVGQCSKGYYSIMSPLDRNEPYYLEKLVALDDGNVACGKYQKDVSSVEVTKYSVLNGN